MTKGDSKNAKKKNNKKTSKNKSSLSRGNKKKPGMPNVSNDLSQKLYATMEKHKEVRYSRLWGEQGGSETPPAMVGIEDVSTGPCEIQKEEVIRGVRRRKKRG